MSVRPVVLLLSGPNLNLLGEREPDVYGTESLEDHVRAARDAGARHGLDVEHRQCNHEGDMVDAVHGARGRCAAIVVNPGAFTHYAWSLHDALAAFDAPVVELHLSNPDARETWRHTSVVTPVATGIIAGFGGLGYRLAIEAVATWVTASPTPPGGPGTAVALATGAGAPPHLGPPGASKDLITAMSVSTNDLKNGMTLDLPEGLFGVVEFQHVKPGKGGSFVRTKLKNVRTGAVIERTYRGDEKLEQAIIDKREMQYLYADSGDYVFMDNTTYDQMQVTGAALGAATRYLKEGDSAVLQMYGGEIVGVDLPAAVELEVTGTEPGLQGDRVSGARKPATLETGHTVSVPLFVNQGDRIKVDTRTGDYLTRV